MTGTPEKPQDVGPYARLQSIIGRPAASFARDSYHTFRHEAEATFTPWGRKNRHRIAEFRNRHVGQRCVIIGNGPSLNDTNLHLLRNEVTFGLNRIYLMFDQMGFETTYHAVVNRLVIEQCLDEMKQLAIPSFSTMQNRDLLEDSPNFALMRTVEDHIFSKHIERRIWEGMTVTYVAMQLAYFMGFEKVILVGVDHRFAVSGTPHQVVESTGADESHFDPRYFGKGFKWQLPDLPVSEQAYTRARHAFESAGRTIVDATVDGALTVFPKTRLEDALR